VDRYPGKNSSLLNIAVVTGQRMDRTNISYVRITPQYVNLFQSLFSGTFWVVYSHKFISLSKNISFVYACNIDLYTKLQRSSDHCCDERT